MARHNKEPQDRLYTASLPPSLLKLVLRIQAQYGVEFRTRSFTAMPDQAHGARWWEAVRHEDGLWQIDEYEVVLDVYSDEDDQHSSTATAVKKNALLGGMYVCFFDALHACAAFEATARSLGLKPTGETKEQLSAQHYRAFAKREKIPFDKKTNLPVPVADGKVLVDGGVFDLDDLAVARKSKGNLSKSSPAIESVAVSALAKRSNKKMTASLQKFNDQAAIKKNLQDTRYKLTRLSDTFDEVVAHKFSALTKGGLHTGAFSLGCAGSTGIATGSWLVFLSTDGAFSALNFLSYMSGFMMSLASVGLGIAAVSQCVDEWGQTKMPHRQFKRGLKKFYNHIAQYPDSLFKDDAVRLSAEIKFAYHVLATRQAYREVEAKNGGYWASRRLKKRSEELSDIALSHGMDKGKVALLFESIEQDISSTSYDSRIQENVRKKVQELAKLIGKLRRAPDEQFAMKLLAPATGREKHGPA